MPNYWSYLTPNCRKNGRIWRRKSALPPWQHTGWHLRHRYGQISQISLRTAAPSTVFGPVRLFLFPNLKKPLAGQKFESSEEVIAATEAYLADLEKTYFSDGLKKLEHHCVKCIQLKGDYVEKWIATFPKFSFFILQAKYLSDYPRKLGFLLLTLIYWEVWSSTARIS